jgi:uncharacterized protein YjbI with pentapeptide repeats
MANEEHVAILKQGVNAWNEWRAENPKVAPDLSEADLHMLDFSKGQLNWVNPKKVHVQKVRLDAANLRRVNLQGADFGPLSVPEELNNKNGLSVYLLNADLSNADLQEADLREANFERANLYNVDLRRAVLLGADFQEANLSFANLEGANLNFANLGMSVLDNATFDKAFFGYTKIWNVDLSSVIGLDSIEHLSPSTIGIDTIYRSQGKIPEVFLRGAGVPDSFITYMRSLTGEAIKYYSCFICHSSQDTEIAERLYANLQAKGVRCWYAPEDLRIGEPYLFGIDRGIRLHDKLLIVLSEKSVGSKWVEQEVLMAMGKDPGGLFPIRLDDAVMQTHVPWAHMIRQSRQIGDFTHWKEHDAYQKAFDRLLRDLKAEAS